jgi:MFS transporter, FSR family, fosmidomycin resistance protein
LLDEFVFGAREAAWPLIRRDLDLDYVQIGLALGIPSIVSSLVEPILGVLGDTHRRRTLILGGGAVFAAALLLFALSPNFLLLLTASALLYPASGAFVGLSQASLMDLQPERREHNMTRWTAAGSVGAVTGPLLLAGLLAAHFGWRPLFLFLALLTLPVLALSAWQRDAHTSASGEHGLRAALRGAVVELRRPAVLRWLTLLECSDLLLDVLLGFLGLYLVDAVHATPAQAALAVTVWTGAGLAGNLLLLPVLDRIDGLRYLRASALTALILFPAMLLAPGFVPKLVLLAALGVINSGWYPVLQARLYAELPDRSGTVMAVSTIFGTGAGILPFLIGLVAQGAGVGPALWLLLAGPAIILLALPRGGKYQRSEGPF